MCKEVCNAYVNKMDRTMELWKFRHHGNNFDCDFYFALSKLWFYFFFSLVYGWRFVIDCCLWICAVWTWSDETVWDEIDYDGVFTDLNFSSEDSFILCFKGRGWKCQASRFSCWNFQGCLSERLLGALSGRKILKQMVRRQDRLVWISRNQDIQIFYQPC